MELLRVHISNELNVYEAKLCLSGLAESEKGRNNQHTTHILYIWICESGRCLITFIFHPHHENVSQETC